jgi:TolB protein
MRIVRMMLAAGLGAAWLAWGLAAADDIVVVKPGAEKTVIDVAGVKVTDAAGGEVFRETLKRDLVRSGWFRLAEGAPSVLALSGRLSGGGGGGGCRFDARVTALSGGRDLMNRACRRTDADYRRLAHEVADAVVEAVKGRPGIASTRIAMVGAAGGGKDVYICDADGANLVRITHQRAVCLSPNWYPDASALVYTSFHGGYPDLYRLDLVAKRRKRLAAFPGINTGAALDPRGRRMALILSKDGNPELYVTAASGGSRPVRLTRTRHASEASPSWSPDGDRIVYVSDGAGSPQLYIIGRDGGRPKRLTFRGSENVSPDWGPGGRIAYVSRREGRYRLFVTDPATGQEEQVSADGADYEDPSWAPDGRHLVCARTQRYRSELYILDTLGDPPIRLTTVGGDWYSPSWSPR